jgi:hypothetical protein
VFGLQGTSDYHPRLSQLIQLGHNQDYQAPYGAGPMLSMVVEVVGSSNPRLQEAVVAALVSMRDRVKITTEKLLKVTGRHHFISPRHFLDLIRKFVGLERQQRSQLEERQTHIRTGLQNMLET